MVRLLDLQQFEVDEINRRLAPLAPRQTTSRRMTTNALLAELSPIAELRGLLL